MALTSALNMTLNGMMTTELRTNLTSQNIANADKEGYTRKSLNAQYITTNVGSVPVSGVVVGARDSFLVAALTKDLTTYSYDLTVTNSLDYYNTQLGSTEGSYTLSSYIDDMYSTLKFLATSPETAANKSEVVNVAANLANSLRDLSSDIQKQRMTAEQQINTSINNINSVLDRIQSLNIKIATTDTDDAGYADYQDQRDLELQSLAKEMDVQYFYTSDNMLQIYTKSGQSLLLSQPHYISYTPTNVIHSTTLYPAGFSPITLDGVDITSQLSGGKLGANLYLRDDYYVGEQEKLNELASVLQTQVNTLLNTGASIPGRSLMEGSLQGLTAATPFTGTGTIRVATTDQSGVVVSYSDINLAAMTSVNDVLTALNGIAGITATLNTDGELSIAVTPSTNGVAINPMTSSITSSSGESFSQYFGLNDMFVGTGAEDIKISDYLVARPDYLSIAKLNSSATLAVGDQGVARGDGSVADSLANLLTSTLSFNAAGNFSAQSNSLLAYAQAFMSDVATQSSIAQGQSDTSYLVYSTSYGLVTSVSGVNVDEETAKMLILQNQYAASAQVISTIQEMLDALINAMR
ncbi:MAG: flagellar hook-associated protein FlgK [Pseudobdellovibrionaceae bacterium]|jgi:flagellar hook-associated protein 1 FlgK|nr:flagellar hook-associated protein FlgK [Pseudobdellovibrionaceae bacterium]